MDTLELARECGATIGETFVKSQTDSGPHQFVEMMLPALAEFESRIRADEREKAAKVCEAIETQHWNDFKGRYIGPHPRPQTRGNPYTDGQASGASDCASAIRSQK